MINVFRRLRHTIFSTGSISKYLFYALGEIILVVFGILIALQVNNWNENRKERLKEINIYNEILSELRVSKVEIEYDMNQQVKGIETTEILKQHLLNKRPLHETIKNQLLQSAENTQFYAKTSGYENLKSLGLDLLQNDTIRMAISSLYELDFMRLRNIGEEYDQFDNIKLQMSPFLVKHITVDPNAFSDLNGIQSSLNLKTNQIKIKDYKSMINDGDLLITLQKSIFDRAHKISLHEEVLNDTKITIQLIENELERLSN